MNMVTRTIDFKGKIKIPAEALGDYPGRWAYFAYSPEKDEIYMIGISGIRKAQENLREEYGVYQMINVPSRTAHERVGSQMDSAAINANGRVIIPERMRNAAEIVIGDILEARVVQGKGIALKKAS